MEAPSPTHDSGRGLDSAQGHNGPKPEPTSTDIFIFINNPTGLLGLIVPFLGGAIFVAGLFFVNGWRQALIMVVGIAVGALLILVAVLKHLIDSYHREKLHTRERYRSDPIVK